MTNAIKFMVSLTDILMELKRLKIGQSQVPLQRHKRQHITFDIRSRDLAFLSREIHFSPKFHQRCPEDILWKHRSSMPSCAHSTWTRS